MSLSLYCRRSLCSGSVLVVSSMNGMSLIMSLFASLIRFALWSGSFLNCPLISDVVLTFVLLEMHLFCFNKFFTIAVSRTAESVHSIWQSISSPPNKRSKLSGSVSGEIHLLWVSNWKTRSTRFCCFL